MAEEKKTESAPKAKVATETLYANGWVKAFTPGQEVPEHVLASDVAKENDWKAKVK